MIKKLLFILTSFIVFINISAQSSEIVYSSWKDVFYVTALTKDSTKYYTISESKNTQKSDNRLYDFTESQIIDFLTCVAKTNVDFIWNNAITVEYDPKYLKLTNIKTHYTCQVMHTTISRALQAVSAYGSDSTIVEGAPITALSVGPVLFQPIPTSGKHLHAAAWYEVGSFMCGIGAGASAFAGAPAGSYIFSAGALICWFAKVYHINAAGENLKLTATDNGIGVQYTIGNKR